MTRLRREFDLLLVAAQFLTRLPVPEPSAFTPDMPTRAVRWFPLVGWLVGAISAGVWLAAGRLWSAPVAALLAVGAGALATGAFHEDGLADTFDGLGGGTTPERRLAIMKDSRIGGYGALALGVVAALRVGALASLAPWAGAGALIAAHGAARAGAVAVMRLTPYVGDPGAAKGRDGALRPSAGETLCALALGAAGLALAPWPGLSSGVASAAFATTALAWTSRRLVGGHTGDVLGAVEQLAEAAFLLGAAARV